MRNQSISIQIDIDRPAVYILLVIMILLSLSGSVARADVSQSPVSAASTTITGRQYYLTSSTYLGNLVLSACDDGYHTASLWEIYDVSNLIYNLDLGYKHIPADGAPPTNEWGWVRNGNVPSIGLGGNCALWSFAYDYSSGTVISLPNNWDAPGSTMGVWKTSTSTCDIPRRVWCVEN